MRADFIENRHGGQGAGRVGLHRIESRSNLVAQPVLHGRVTFLQRP